MERVETLLKKLQQQFAANASADQLLLTVQMLQAELAHLQHADAGNGLISVDIPQVLTQINGHDKETAPVKTADEERTVEVLQVDEAELEAELEEIKRNAEAMQKISTHNKPQIVFEPEEEDIPTLAHQQGNQTAVKKEINEAISFATEMLNDKLSLNDKLKQSRLELSETLTEVPIRDLKKVIGVNDRFLYITELFRGDETMYERSIKTINSFSILPEAEYWIQRELKVKLGWNDNNETVKQFTQLIKRRFT